MAAAKNKTTGSGYKSELVSDLANRIMHHKILYYSGKPEISDVDYDTLEERLRKLAPGHPALGFIGSDPDASTGKVNHDVPMLSLAKTYDMGELGSWMNGRQTIGTWKVDGNSLSVLYRDGVLVQAKTRGNGRTGEDVTEKAQWVADLVPRPGVDFALEVRGELYCSQTSFARLSDEMVALGLECPTSPRNIVAGLLGRKSHYNLARHFNFLAFDLLVPGGDVGFETEMEKLQWLGDRGFRLPDPTVLEDIDGARRYLDSVRTLMEEDEIGLDGAVFTYNGLSLHEELGNTSHHPRFKMSFKWQGQTAQSTVTEITWATSRLGIVTPVAVIEPVQLSGAKITNITLHNASHVKAYNLKAKDRIEIVRSGEVIPKFLAVVKAASGSCVLPDKCPACSAKLDFDDVRLKCPNVSECPAQKSGAILNWIRCAGIDDLSEKRLEQLVEHGFVKRIADLYRVGVEDFLKLPLTKEKMAEKLFKNIQQTKDLPLARFLNGLGIEGTGLTTWEKLLERFPTLKKMQAAREDEIAALDGFAERSAGQIVGGLGEKLSTIKELLETGLKPTPPQPPSSSGANLPLSGRQIVITGTLSQPRSQIEAMIKEAGGKTGSAVSKNTYALVTNNPESSSSKMKKARALGVNVWNEKDLADAIGKSN